MQEWRWDQGRVLYFQYDVLKAIARVLTVYDGLNVNDDLISEKLKSDLVAATGLPFLPSDYKVMRNYSRVFQCGLLAVKLADGRLAVSDIGRLLGSEENGFSAPDDYLAEVINRFRYPFPAFKDYDDTAARVYPFCALIKFLVAKLVRGEEPRVSLKDIVSYLIGNGCTGLEDLDFYLILKPTAVELNGDSLRQLREMIIFISQISFLKTYKGYLYLDIFDEDEARQLLSTLIKPVVKLPSAGKAEEFLSLTSVEPGIYGSDKGPSIAIPLDVDDMLFAEGRRKRVQHLRVERSPMIRRIYMRLHPEPVCDACGTYMRSRYPWVDYLLDLHHLLPLSSCVRTDEMGTALSDMVGLCPSCHRAVHAYYRRWLADNGADDFSDKEEAMNVYLEAIREIA